MIEDFLHLPPVSLTPVANLELRISPRIFETTLMVYLGAWGKLIHEKKQKSKISWHCPFKVISIFFLKVKVHHPSINATKDKFAVGVNYTSGKFSTSINGTDGKFFTDTAGVGGKFVSSLILFSVNNTGSKFATGVNDTEGK